MEKHAEIPRSSIIWETGLKRMWTMDRMHETGITDWGVWSRDAALSDFRISKLNLS